MVAITIVACPDPECADHPSEARPCRWRKCLSWPLRECLDQQSRSLLVEAEPVRHRSHLEQGRTLARRLHPAGHHLHPRVRRAAQGATMMPVAAYRQSQEQRS